MVTRIITNDSLVNAYAAINDSIILITINASIVVVILIKSKLKCCLIISCCLVIILITVIITINDELVINVSFWGR